MTDWKFLWNKYTRINRRPELEAWKILKRIKGISFIDVGANRGLVYTFPLHDHFFRTYAIEPHPRLARWIRLEIERRGIRNGEWGGIEVQEWAASDRDGQGLLYANHSIPGGSRTLVPERASLISKPEGTIQVRTRILDNWWGDAPIELLKIDVEGQEFEALQGAERILRLTKNLMVELHPPNDAGKLWRFVFERFQKASWVDPTHIYGWNP